MVTVLFHSTIFGPIRSRRLGVSLGVNLSPNDGKVCSFDCIYCEAGYNSQGVGTTGLPKREDVSRELEEKLLAMMQAGEQLDVITFSGNGEPTLHPQFSEIINDTIALRDKYFPNAKVSVLSNATLIGRPSVFEALNKVDNNILKLDTVNADYVARVDRPNDAYKLNDIIDCMRAFNGKLVVQTMFMKGCVDGVSVDNTGDEYVQPWLEVVKSIAPREVMIYTIDRETPQQGLLKATHEELDHIVALLTDAGIKASASY